MKPTIDLEELYIAFLKRKVRKIVQGKVATRSFRIIEVSGVDYYVVLEPNE